jgi:integrase/recombinase XerD
MDRWAWEQLDPWLRARVALPVGALLCVIDGPTQGRPWAPAAVRATFRSLAVRAGVRRRFAPHQLRHAHAIEMAREGVSLNVIQRQLGHANLGITSVYLQGIDNTGDHRDGGRPRRADASGKRRAALTVLAHGGSA